MEKLFWQSRGQHRKKLGIKVFFMEKILHKLHFLEFFSISNNLSIKIICPTYNLFATKVLQ